MQKSKRIYDAFTNAMTFGDSEEIEEIVTRMQAGTRMDYYVSMDADNAGIFECGAEAERTAADLGLQAFYGEFDDCGVWVFSARSEGHVVTVLQKVAAELAGLCEEVEQEMEKVYPPQTKGEIIERSVKESGSTLEYVALPELRAEDFLGLPNVNDQEDC